MSTATSSTATLGERFAQWRKDRRLERQGRNVASRQMRGGASSPATFSSWLSP